MNALIDEITHLNKLFGPNRLIPWSIADYAANSRQNRLKVRRLLNNRFNIHSVVSSRASYIDS